MDKIISTEQIELIRTALLNKKTLEIKKILDNLINSKEESIIKDLNDLLRNKGRSTILDSQIKGIIDKYEKNNKNWQMS